MDDDTKNENEDLENKGATGPTGSDDDKGQADTAAADDKGEADDTFSPFADSGEGDKGDGKKKGEGDDEMDDEDKQAIDARIREQTSGYDEKLSRIEREQSIDSFLADEKNEHLKPYASKMKEIARDPRSAVLDTKAIARLAVDPAQMIAEGARLEREAQAEGKSSVTGGAGNRPSSGGGELPNAWELSTEEFNKTVEKELEGKR